MSLLEEKKSSIYRLRCILKAWDCDEKLANALLDTLSAKHIRSWDINSVTRLVDGLFRQRNEVIAERIAHVAEYVKPITPKPTLPIRKPLQFDDARKPG